MRDKDVSRALLDWYDTHARDLPWRVPPGANIRPDPYRIWLSEVMLQQTTVAAVKDYFHRFTTRWPDVHALAAAVDEDVMGEWAGLGYYARARNLLKCARVVAAQGGKFPSDHDALLKLPGIGPYTAAAISAIAFDRRAVVVDGNVERVIARLFAVQTPLPTAKPELTALADRLTPDLRPGDYAQAVMDLGATICTPKGPTCAICPAHGFCMASASNVHTDLPRKLPKTPKPTRRGVAYVGRRADGQWLLETRPQKGLLGGMLGWPCTEWSDAPADIPDPAPGNWQDVGAEVRHTFTHFHLKLALRVADLPMGTVPARGAFRPLRPSDLPTVMRKAFDLARRALPDAP